VVLRNVSIGEWEASVPEWIGIVMFLGAAGLSGSKIAEDFGQRGLRGYAMLMLLFVIYSGAVGAAFV
jgi:hypothetical protein